MAGEQDGTGPKNKTQGAADRKARLADALRANLKKRKAQGQKRASAQDEDNSG